VEQPRLTSALGALPSVAFSPADVSLVTGGPSERRRYLDVMLALSSSAYLFALQQYRAALLRRNAALRLAQRDGGRSHDHDAQVSLWEPAMAAHGGVVAAVRHAFVHEHAERYRQLCTAIGERHEAQLRYTSVGGENSTAHAVDADVQREVLTRSFGQQRANEIRRGVTMVGPHRDELQLHLGGRELRTFGSAGQQRSAAIALRLLELSTLCTAIGYAPLLLLDDPFAELDLGRAGRVLRLLEDAGAAQVLLAVPREEDIPEAYTRLERRYMRDGALS
jgi:DNA replication and repair protein RecF